MKLRPNLIIINPGVSFIESLNVVVLTGFELCVKKNNYIPQNGLEFVPRNKLPFIFLELRHPAISIYDIDCETYTALNVYK